MCLLLCDLRSHPNFVLILKLILYIYTQMEAPEVAVLHGLQFEYIWLVFAAAGADRQP